MIKGDGDMDIQEKEFFFLLIDRLVQWQKHENHEPLELLSIDVQVDKYSEYVSRILVKGTILDSERELESAYQSKHPNDREFFADMANYFELGHPIGSILAFYQYCCVIPKGVEASEVLKELQQECNRRYPNAEINFYFPSSSNQGCYIATAVYGSYDCPEVWTLRRFRDNALRLTWYGRIFIKEYYKFSPKLIKWFGGYPWFNHFWRKYLNRMVTKLQKQGYESTPYRDK